jgi:hypothetical protein
MRSTPTFIGVGSAATVGDATATPTSTAAANFRHARSNEIPPELVPPRQNTRKPRWKESPATASAEGRWATLDAARVARAQAAVSCPRGARKRQRHDERLLRERCWDASRSAQRGCERQARGAHGRKQRADEVDVRKPWSRSSLS